jgi:lactosylceramide 4-alpha-galactosyltransferase
MLAPPARGFCRRCPTLLRAVFALLAFLLYLLLPAAPAPAAPRAALAAPRARPASAPAEPHFWFIWTVNLDTWHWMPLSVVESVFKFHPRARVTFLSQEMPLDFFACFRAGGFDISVERYDLEALARGTLLADFVAEGRLNKSVSYRYAHESDLVRIVVLSKFGGIYVDTDLVLVRALDAGALENPSLGVEYYEDPMVGSKTYGSLRLNNAFMGFPQPGHPFLQWVMTQVQSSYNPDEWAAIGPDLITEGYKRLPHAEQDSFNLMPPRALYPLHWARAHILLRPDRTELDKDWPPAVRGESFGIHLYNSNSWRHYDGSCVCGRAPASVFLRVSLPHRPPPPHPQIVATTLSQARRPAAILQS